MIKRFVYSHNTTGPGYPIGRWRYRARGWVIQINFGMGAGYQDANGVKGATFYLAWCSGKRLWEKRHRGRFWWPLECGLTFNGNRAPYTRH